MILRTALNCVVRITSRGAYRGLLRGVELYPEHDLFIQQMKLKNTLRAIMGEELMTHLGLDYCE